jgi:hypothetical protein
MCTYGVEICYNDKPPLRCFSRERGGVHVHLYTAKSGHLQLDVSVKQQDRSIEYSLPAIAPGDSLSFRFLQRARSGPQSIARLNQFARRAIAVRRLRKGRLGLDFRLKTGDTVRTSHPARGGFSFMLGNIPLNHARAFVMAWNREERWHWQLPDLHPDDQVSFQIVETDWCDQPQIVKAA